MRFFCLEPWMKIDNLNIHLSGKESQKNTFDQYQKIIAQEIESCIRALSDDSKGKGEGKELPDITIKLPSINVNSGNLTLGPHAIRNIRQNILNQFNQWLSAIKSDRNHSINDYALTKKRLFQYLSRSGLKAVDVLDDTVALGKWLKEDIFAESQSIQPLLWLTESPKRMVRWLTLLKELNHKDRLYIIKRFFNDSVTYLVNDYINDHSVIAEDCPFVSMFLLNRQNSSGEQQPSANTSNLAEYQQCLRLIYQDRQNLSPDLLKSLLPELPKALLNTNTRFLSNWNRVVQIQGIRETDINTLCRSLSRQPSLALHLPAGSETETTEISAYDQGHIVLLRKLSSLYKSLKSDDVQTSDVIRKLMALSSLLGNGSSNDQSSLKLMVSDALQLNGCAGFLNDITDHIAKIESISNDDDTYTNAERNKDKIKACLVYLYKHSNLPLNQMSDLASKVESYLELNSEKKLKERLKERREKNENINTTNKLKNELVSVSEADLEDYTRKEIDLENQDRSSEDTKDRLYIDKYFDVITSRQELGYLNFIKVLNQSIQLLSEYQNNHTSIISFEPHRYGAVLLNLIDQINVLVGDVDVGRLIASFKQHLEKKPYITLDQSLSLIQQEYTRVTGHIIARHTDSLSINFPEPIELIKPVVENTLRELESKHSNTDLVESDEVYRLYGVNHNTRASHNTDDDSSLPVDKSNHQGIFDEALSKWSSQSLAMPWQGKPLNEFLENRSLFNLHRLQNWASKNQGDLPLLSSDTSIQETISNDIDDILVFDARQNRHDLLKLNKSQLFLRSKNSPIAGSSNILTKQWFKLLATSLDQFNKSVSSIPEAEQERVKQSRFLVEAILLINQLPSDLLLALADEEQARLLSKACTLWNKAVQHIELHVFLKMIKQDVLDNISKISKAISQFHSQADESKTEPYELSENEYSDLIQHNNSVFGHEAFHDIRKAYLNHVKPINLTPLLSGHSDAQWTTSVLSIQPDIARLDLSIHQYQERMHKTSERVVQHVSDWEKAKNQLERKQAFFNDLEKAQPWHTQDVGLVLLWPFLARYFKKQKLTDGAGQFLSEAHQYQALLSLYQQSELELDIDDMITAKLLIGLHPDHEVDIDLPVASEYSKTINLVELAIRSWPKAKSMSVSGFKQMFLNREGNVVVTEQGYLIEVEKRAEDILLTQLPWGLGVIHLPWFGQKLLNVNW